ncbi:MAG TPA: N-acetylneuraminate synthase family protein [Dissulfurispiraceae bacterium]
MNDYFTQPLFVFEMANNHMGSVKHGLAMIDAFAEIAQSFQFRFAFKFQFRHLETFIHPDYKARMELKYVKRFTETQLIREDFAALKERAEQRGFLTMCTPFDEPSVELIEELGFAVIKIASCSFTDWPLLERIARTDKPIIASVSGAALEEIDKVVSFFKHRDKDFALLHCVGEYPTRPENLQLNQLDLLKKRYPDVPIGFSTHEEPDNFDSVKIAVAKGAMVFEKHVALETEEFGKNEYSATPEQVRHWLQSASAAMGMCGVAQQRSVPTKKELSDLRQFKRGVFARRMITKGEKIDSGNTFFAFPNTAGQVLANDMSKYLDMFAERDLEKNASVLVDDISTVDKREKVYAVVQRVKEMLRSANIVVPGRASLEISHHYGIERFHETGCTIVTVVNREYCKKLIILFPGQRHPEQYHKMKEETFVVLHGDLKLALDNEERYCKAGDIVTVHRGVKHPFMSEKGAIIEEISSTHYKDDSYYTDPAIHANKDRKTVLSYWME